MEVVDRALGLLLLVALAVPTKASRSASSTLPARLRDLRLGELIALLQTGCPKTHVEIDLGSVDHGLRMARDIAQRAAQLDHFIVHGATTGMLRYLFKTSAAEIKARRKTLVGEHRRRRPQLPTPPVREAIQASWWHIRTGRRSVPPTADEFERLRQAHPVYTFATLYAVVNEFE